MLRRRALPGFLLISLLLALLMTGLGGARAQSQAVDIRVQDGFPTQVPADGASQTLLVVAMAQPSNLPPDNPNYLQLPSAGGSVVADLRTTNACWLAAHQAQQRGESVSFSAAIVSSLGTLTPDALSLPYDRLPAPVELVFTAGTEPGPARVRVTIEYCIGAVDLLGVCASDDPADSGRCEGEVVIPLGPVDAQAQGGGDRDGDGLPDGQDACPDTFAQTPNGCPQEAIDSDGDGLADQDDLCPDTYALTDTGCPDFEQSRDTDGDGLLDQDDLCPQLYALTDNGCPDQEPDSDGDGIPNVDDLCPGEYGATPSGCPEGMDSDGDGIPDDQDLCPGDPGLSDTGCPISAVPPPDTASVDDSDQGPSPGQAALGSIAITALMAGVTVVQMLLSGLSGAAAPGASPVTAAQGPPLPIPGQAPPPRPPAGESFEENLHQTGQDLADQLQAAQNTVKEVKDLRDQADQHLSQEVKDAIDNSINTANGDLNSVIPVVDQVNQHFQLHDQIDQRLGDQVSENCRDSVKAIESATKGATDIAVGAHDRALDSLKTGADQVLRPFDPETADRVKTEIDKQKEAVHQVQDGLVRLPEKGIKSVTKGVYGEYYQDAAANNPEVRDLRGPGAFPPAEGFDPSVSVNKVKGWWQSAKDALSEHFWQLRDVPKFDDSFY